MGEYRKLVNTEILAEVHRQLECIDPIKTINIIELNIFFQINLHYI